MCGAFSQYTDYTLLSERFAAEAPNVVVPKRYNIRPSQPVPVIFNTDDKKIDFAMWGVHPFYDKTGKVFLINARNDSLSKPMWKKLLQEKRCLILADGFYEWKKKGAYKVPYRFEMKNKEPFAFAGLWQEEKDGEGHIVPHCVIITTEPNELVSDVHNRMPAILSKEDEREWLNPDVEVENALNLLHPYKDCLMNAYTISTLINSPKNDSVELMYPSINSA